MKLATISGILLPTIALMTRPLSEPDIYKEVGRHGFRVSQLERRPKDPTAELSAPSTVYHKISAVGQNESLIFGDACYLTGYYICNIAATYRYVKLFDKATTPDVGVDTPAITLGIPPLSAANIGFESFPEFLLGLGLATVTGIADLDATNLPAIQELAINIYFLVA